MIKPVQFIIVVSLLFLVLLVPVVAQDKGEWTWTDKSGQQKTLRELKELLQEHEEWVKSRGGAGIQADLSGAILREAILYGADLREAILREADLSGAKLHGADLSEAQVRGVDPRGADLSGAILRRADLSETKLRGANLYRADLGGADLSGADLFKARLEGTIFEPTSLPRIARIATAFKLALMTYKESPIELTQLRTQFKDGGFREQERKITFALRKAAATEAWGQCKRLSLGNWRKWGRCLEYWFNTVFFDLTCQYGMSPWRPLLWGVVPLWLLCSLFYSVVIRTRTSREAALYRVYPQSLQHDSSANRRVERVSPTPKRPAQGIRRFGQFLLREWLVLRTALGFSLICAFNIGFRDINFGRWLRLLTRQEFDIKAAGWARVVAGWQSLISVYLVALWVLSYFGRPFD